MSATVNPPEHYEYYEQRMQALHLANEVRTGTKEVRMEVRAGLLTIADALVDPRAQAMPLGRLLNARAHWGPMKTDKLCKRLGVWPMRRVRDLTERQRAVISHATR